MAASRKVIYFSSASRGLPPVVVRYHSLMRNPTSAGAASFKKDPCVPDCHVGELCGFGELWRNFGTIHKSLLGCTGKTVRAIVWEMSGTRGTAQLHRCATLPVLRHGITLPLGHSKGKVSRKDGSGGSGCRSPSVPHHPPWHLQFHSQRSHRHQKI